MFGGKSIVVVVLAGMMICSGARAAFADEERGDWADDALRGDAPIMCMTGASYGSASGPRQDIGQFTSVAADIYDRISRVQSARDTADIQVMDAAILQAEDKVSLPPPLKFNHALKLKQLIAWMLDRLLWGGALSAFAAALAWLARRQKERDVARLLMSLCMVTSGCAYALLLPLIAVLVIAGFVAFQCHKARAVLGSGCKAIFHPALPTFRPVLSPVAVADKLERSLCEDRACVPRELTKTGSVTRH
jgi:hypothetical protein